MESNNEPQNEQQNEQQNTFGILDLNLVLTEYKTKSKHRHIERYNILGDDNKILYHNVCNIWAPFGRETETYKKGFVDMNQQRFNVCFSKDDIKYQIKPYINMISIIKSYELFFSQIDDFKNYTFESNIIDRKKYGIVIRCHLKTFKTKTTTPLTQIINNQSESVEWINYDPNVKANIDFHFDCLWVDQMNKKYGISITIDNVMQVIVN